MKFCLLSEAASSAIHLLYYAQTQGLKFSDLIMVGDGSERYEILHEQARINRFGLHFVDDPNSQKCLDVLRDIVPDVLVLMVSVVVRKPLLAIPKVATVNTHAGILPQYRGVDSRRWAILEGGPVGVTAHLVNPGVDTGDILARRELELKPGDTIGTISERNYYLNKWQTLVEALLQIQGGVAQPTPQRPEEGRQYFWMHPKLAGVVDRLLLKKSQKGNERATDVRVRREWEELYNQPGQFHKNRYPNDDIVRFVMRNFSKGERRSMRILDLGCGWGNNLRFLHDEGFEAWGIDGSATACCQCFTITPRVVLGSMIQLPLASDSFDAVIDRNSIQCNTIDAVQSIVRQVHRVLKPGGVLYSIMLAQTNQPQCFHAYYLTTPQSELSREMVEQMFALFSSLEIDHSERTYNGGDLFLHQWHITARKDG